MAEDARLRILIEAIDKGVTQVFRDIGSHVQKLDEQARLGRDAIRNLGLGLSAFGAGGVLTGKQMVSAFLEQERAVKTLATVINNTGQSWDTHRHQVELVTTALMHKTAVADEQQMRALALMIPILGDVNAALTVLPAVLDVAAVTGQGLEMSARGVSEALTGQTDTIMRTGLEFDKAMGPTERLALIMQKLGGAAAANADPMSRLGVSITETKEKIGAAVMPALTILTDAFIRVLTWIQRIDPRLLALAGTFAVAAVAFASVAGPLALFVGFLPQIAAGIAVMQAMTIAISGAAIATWAWLWPVLALAVGIQALIWMINEFNDGLRSMGINLPHIMTPLEGMGKAVTAMFDQAGTAIDNLVTDHVPKLNTAMIEMDKSFSTMTQHEKSSIPVLNDVGAAIETIASDQIPKLNIAMSEVARNRAMEELAKQVKIAREAHEAFAGYLREGFIPALLDVGLHIRSGITRSTEMMNDAMKMARQRIGDIADFVSKNLPKKQPDNMWILPGGGTGMAPGFSLAGDIRTFGGRNLLELTPDEMAADSQFWQTYHRLASQRARQGFRQGPPTEAEVRAQYTPVNVNLYIDGHQISSYLGAAAERSEQARTS